MIGIHVASRFIDDMEGKLLLVLCWKSWQQVDSIVFNKRI
jgi:hypothetical protein